MASEPALGYIYSRIVENPNADWVVICNSASVKFNEPVDIDEAREIISAVVGMVAEGERWYKVLHEVCEGRPLLKVVKKEKVPAKKNAPKKKIKKGGK